MPPSWTIGGDLYLDQSNWPSVWPSYEHYSIMRYVQPSQAYYSNTFTHAFNFVRNQHNENLKLVFAAADMTFTAAELFILKVTQLHTGFFPSRPVLCPCFMSPP